MLKGGGLMNRISQAYVHVTHECNMDCIGCNVENIKHHTSSSSLRMEEILDTVIKLKSLGLRHLILTGGEPFIREDILEICKYIKTRIGIENLTIITNGSLDYGVYEEVIPYIDDLIISIDGYNENTSFLRDVTPMEKVLGNIDKLRNSIVSSIEVKIHKKNKDYIIDYINLSKKLGVYTSFNIMNLSKDHESYQEYILNDHDLMDISHSLLETQKIIDPLRTRINQINIFCDTRCKIGCDSVSVDVIGDMYPCRFLNYEKLRLGNILDDGFKGIINFNQIVSKQFDVDNINECRNCEYKNMCQGGCRARSYHHNGTLFSPDIYCGFLKKYFKIKKVQLKQSI